MSIRLTTPRNSHQYFPRLRWGIWCGSLLAVMATGCTAMHPIRGVPASYLPEQFEGPSRDNKRTIDLSLLVRTPPDQHRVAAGDVLSIYVPRVLGSQPTEVNSVGIEPPINMPASVDDPPTVGYPIQVRDDNTIALPQIPPIPVGNMTLREVEMAIRKAYSVDHRILNPEEAMVLVSLQRPRIHRVLVVRQEANTSLTTSTQPGSVNIGTTGKGTARTVTLKAYENDVLHALSQGEGVDGLPGLNAENVIYIIRRRQRGINGPGLGCPPAEPVGIPGQPPIPFPIQEPGFPNGADPNGFPILPPATSSLNRPQQPFAPGRIQTVGYEQMSYEQPVVTPQPYGSYRGTPEAGAAHSLMKQSNRSFTPGHSAAGVVIPSPYSNRQDASPAAISQTQYSQTQYNQALPIQPIPADQSTLPMQTTSPGQAFPPMEPGGHSWGSLPPAPAGQDLSIHHGYAMPDPSWNSMLENFDPTIDNPNIIRIPVRLGPGEQPNITEELITLYDGDIVFIDSRETEVFYTAGLLGGGQYTLPRDYDLGVLEAVSIAEGRTTGSGGGGNGLNRSIGGVSALNHDVSNSASRLAILRTLPNGKRITIEVDLNKAMRYQQENIRIQPGDILFLQYTLPEAVCAFTQRYLFEGAIFSLAASQFQSNR